MAETDKPSSRRDYLKTLGGVAAVAALPAAADAQDAAAASDVRANPERISVLDFIPRAEHAALRAGSSGYDCTSAIQAAVDHAIYGGGKGVVHLPAGRYPISATIHLGYGTGFSSVVLQGEGYAYRSQANFDGSAVVCKHSDAPAFNFQGARGSVLRDLSIAGNNADWIRRHKLGSNTPGAPLLDDTRAESWLDPALGAAAASAHAPYAAVTIDAYAGAKPDMAYPDVRYPQRLGATDAYGKAFSSDCLIENVHIDGFVVGICNQPCDADGNGDFTTIRRVTIECVQYAISVGNTQSRNVRIEGVKVGPAFCALTTRRHGRGAGKLNGTIAELSLSEVINVLDLGGTAYAGPLTLLHAYGEAIWRLGDIQATSSNETSVIFQSCQFAFSGQNPTRGVPATVLGGGQQPIDLRFVGCALDTFPSVLSFHQNGVEFDGTLVAPTQRHAGGGIAAYVATAHNASCGGVLLNGLRRQGRQRIKFKQIDAESGEVGAATLCDDEFPAARRYGIPLYVPTVSAHDAPGDRVVRPHTRVAVAEHALADVAIDGRVLAFTLPAAFDEAYVINNGFEIGDIVWYDKTGTVLFVRARNGRRIEAEAQNNFRGDAHTGIAWLAPLTGEGNFYSSNGRLFTPRVPLFGDVVAGSATIAVAPQSRAALAEIHAGDALFVDPYAEFAFTPAAARVVACDTQRGRIVLSGIAAIDQPRRRLGVWIRRTHEPADRSAK